MNENVNKIFSSIAKRYDLINTILTLNIDNIWRKKAVALCQLKKHDKVLDLCCGTGQMCLKLIKAHVRDISVTGLDFNDEMLKVARKKFDQLSDSYGIDLVQGDILALPFPDKEFDVVTIAFGIRNISEKGKAFAEILRVLKPGGRVICLELSKPDMFIFRNVYSLYFDHMLPLVGYLVSRDKAAYYYLRDSVNHFMSKPQLKLLMSNSGLVNAEYLSLSGGIASIHYGNKPCSNRSPRRCRSSGK